MARAIIQGMEEDLILIANEGTGDNLLDEDVEAGYVDYVYYTTYTADSFNIEEDDGGMMLLTVPFSEKFKTDEEVIEYVMADLGYKDHDYILF